MKPAHDTQTMSVSIPKDQTFQIDAADIIVLQGKSALDDMFDVSEDDGVTWRSVSVRESVIFTSGRSPRSVRSRSCPRSNPPRAPVNPKGAHLTRQVPGRRDNRHT